MLNLSSLHVIYLSRGRKQRQKSQTRALITQRQFVAGPTHAVVIAYLIMGCNQLYVNQLVSRMEMFHIIYSTCVLTPCYRFISRGCQKRRIKYSSRHASVRRENVGVRKLRNEVFCRDARSGEVAGVSFFFSGCCRDKMKVLQLAQVPLVC